MTKAKPLPCLDLLNKLFQYEPATGTIIYRISVGKKIKAGQKAGTVSNRGYLSIAITINGKSIRFQAHRLIWYIMTSSDPNELQIDHIDGDKLNNKFSNLRLATQTQNMRNRGVNKKSKSQLKGAQWRKDKQKWCAQITVNQKVKHLGYFPTPELAHMAYCKAAAELHGEFARGQ